MVAQKTNDGAASNLKERAASGFPAAGRASEQTNWYKGAYGIILAPERHQSKVNVRKKLE